MNYGSPTDNSSIRVQNQFNLPPAYQSQKTSGFNSQQTPKLTGIQPYTKNVQCPPLVSFNINRNV